MRAWKKNPYWGQGLDKRQARRLRRRNRMREQLREEYQRWVNHQAGTPDCPALPAAGWCDFPGHSEFDLAMADLTPVDPDAHVRQGGDVR